MIEKIKNFFERLCDYASLDSCNYILGNSDYVIKYNRHTKMFDLIHLYDPPRPFPRVDLAYRFAIAKIEGEF